jgi:ribosomal protein S18 acetylase RimI-like enzyme
MMPQAVSALTGGPARTIRPLRRDDVPVLIPVLARAFRDNPLNAHLFPEPRTRVTRLERGFRLYLRQVILPHGRGWVAGDGHGASLWLPPGSFPLPGWRLGLMLPGLAWALGARRFGAGLRTMEEIDRQHPLGKSHWYLLFLGVDPAAQRRSLGTALLRAGLAACDAAHEAAYLETDDPRNLSLYLRHGFQVINEWKLTAGPHFWGLWRDPAK